MIWLVCCDFIWSGQEIKTFQRRTTFEHYFELHPEQHITQKTAQTCLHEHFQTSVNIFQESVYLKIEPEHSLRYNEISFCAEEWEITGIMVLAACHISSECSILF